VGVRKVKAVGTYEGKAVTAQEAAKEFQEIFKLLAGLTREQGLGQLNHPWIYIDRAS